MAVLPPLSVVAVIVALPADTPVTVPPLTDAVPVLLLDQLTVLLVAFDGDMVAVNAT